MQKCAHRVDYTCSIIGECYVTVDDIYQEGTSNGLPRRYHPEMGVSCQY